MILDRTQLLATEIGRPIDNLATCDPKVEDAPRVLSKFLNIDLNLSPTFQMLVLDLLLGLTELRDLFCLYFFLHRSSFKFIIFVSNFMINSMNGIREIIFNIPLKLEGSEATHNLSSIE